MFDDGGLLVILDSTLSANAAIGGAGGAATGTGFAGAAGQGQGGAVFGRTGPNSGEAAAVELISATVADNAASAGGGVFLLGDGTQSTTPVVLVLYNTIVAGSTGGTNDFDTATIDGGSLSFVASNDLIQTDPADGVPPSATIITGEDPLLGPLADNGGPTQTMALLSGSPAIDAGSNNYLFPPPSGGPQTDQRGQPRIVDGGSGQAIIDIGAYEFEPVPTTISVSASDPSPTLGEAVTFTVDVTSTTSDATPTGTVQFMIDGQPFGTPQPLVDGTATSDPDSTLALGPHTITAVYSSDADFTSGTGTLAGGFAVRAVTGTTVVASAQSLNFGQGVTFTATVTNQALGAGTPTGQVDFTDATTGVDLGMATLVNGTASLSPSTPLGVGMHEIVATYEGTSQFFSSASAPQATVVSVVPAPTATTPTVSTASSVYGQGVTFTATVTSALGTPTGSVDFYDLTTGADLGAFPLTNGMANTPAITLGVGANLAGDDVQVISWGDGSGVPTTGNSLVIVGLDNSNLLQIRIFDGAGNYTDISETQLPAAATAIATLKQALPGLLAQNVLSQAQMAQLLDEVRSIVGPTHVIAANYLGAGGFAGSSGQVTETVSSAASASMAIGTPSTSVLGQPVTLSATVAAVAPGSGLPTGSVDFVDTTTDTDLGSAPLVDGAASLSPIATLGFGTHMITATYSGDGSFLPTTGTLDLSVLAAQTSITVTTSPNPAVFGQTLVVQAIVTADAPSTATPTGTVQFTVDGAASGAPIPVSDGVASLPLVGLALGAHTITATFVGDPGFANAAGAVTGGVTVQATTATAIAASASAVAAGQSVTFTATVTTVPAGADSPGRSVTFIDTTDGLDTLGVAALVNGVAQFTPMTPLGAGQHTVVAVYQGDATDLGSNSSSFGSSSPITTVAGSGAPDAVGDGSPATAAALYAPGGVAVDAAGDVFIADTGNHRIREINPQGVITTLTADVKAPTGLAVDALGDLFIADTGDNRVLEMYIDPTTRVVSTSSAIGIVAGTGAAGYSGDGALATAATLDAPKGVAVDDAGDLFIADAGNNRVRQVAVNQTINTIAGTGVARLSGDGGPATAAALSEPEGIAVDAAGDLFIADTSANVIREVSPSGIITTVAGDGVAGFSGDGGPATRAELSDPTAVAVDSAGDLYIADFGNNRVRMVSPSGIITTIAGNGQLGDGGDGGPATAAPVDGPLDIALDQAGDLFLVDPFDGLVREVTTTGLIQTVAGSLTTTPGANGDGGPATAATLTLPTGIAVDAFGDLFIANYGGDRIRAVNAAGIITTVAGNGVPGYGGDGGPANGPLAEVNMPSGVATDAAGNVFIADYTNRLVRAVSSNGTITTVAGNGRSGDTGEASTGTAAAIDGPSAVATDAAGDLFITDTDGGRVLRLANGVVVTVAVAAAASLSGPSAPMAIGQSVTHMASVVAKSLAQSAGVIGADTSSSTETGPVMRGRVRRSRLSHAGASMTSATAVALTAMFHSVDQAIESGILAPRSVAIPTGPTIRAADWRARSASDGSYSIDMDNHRSEDARDAVLDRLAGDIQMRQAVDDEDVKQLAWNRDSTGFKAAPALEPALLESRQITRHRKA